MLLNCGAGEDPGTSRLSKLNSFKNELVPFLQSGKFSCETQISDSSENICSSNSDNWMETVGAPL